MDTANGKEHWIFLPLLLSGGNLLNVKSRSKGIRKRDPDSDPINAGNIGN